MLGSGVIVDADGGGSVVLGGFTSFICPDIGEFLQPLKGLQEIVVDDRMTFAAGGPNNFRNIQGPRQSCQRF
jgi:hypothetical protein